MRFLRCFYLINKYSLGEFVVVIEGEKNISKIDKKNISSEVEKIIKRLLEKFSLTETVEIVHKISYIEKKQIYKKALEIKDENNNNLISCSLVLFFLMLVLLQVFRNWGWKRYGNC